jgi:hypothetical protein
VFEGAYAAELDHWRFIHKHFHPQRRRFWIPTRSSAARATP